MSAHVRTHTSIAFADPFLRCAECQERAEGFHDPERCSPRCGCECPGVFHLTPCGHIAEAVSTCPSWGPVDGCRCDDPGAAHRFPEVSP